MADLTIYPIVLTGVEPTYVACAAGGDAFMNDGRIFIHVKNGGAASRTVTVDSIRPCNQGVDHNAVVAVPAGDERMIGAFNKARFNDANGKAQITYDNEADLTIAAVRLPL